MVLLDSLIKLLPSRPVFAHCDIPCGIYDPHIAQLAAHTVLRMTRLLNEVKVPLDDNTPEKEYTEHHNSVMRMIQVKEEHAEIVKREVTIIWGDYFKEENSKDVPDLHKKVWKILKLASKSKQGIDEKVAQDLLSIVQEFAEIFWKSKGMGPVRIPSGYPTEGEVVSHK